MIVQGQIFNLEPEYVVNEVHMIDDKNFHAEPEYVVNEVYIMWSNLRLL